MPAMAGKRIALRTENPCFGQSRSHLIYQVLEVGSGGCGGCGEHCVHALSQGHVHGADGLPEPPFRKVASHRAAHGLRSGHADPRRAPPTGRKDVGHDIAGIDPSAVRVRPSEFGG